MTSRPPDAVFQPLRTLFGVGAVGQLTDEQLVECFLNRPREVAEAAFAALVGRHGPMVLGVCRRILADPHAAEDAFQATFLVLVRKASSVRVGDSLGRWLFGVSTRIAVRARADTARRRSRERDDPGALDRLAAPPDRDELRGRLDEELARLPEKYRRPLVLCYLGGLTHDEAARRLGWPVGTVRTRLFRGREQLRRRLGRCGVAGSAGVLAADALQAAGPVEPPASLLAATVQAALNLKAGELAVGGVSAAAIAMAQGALRTMFRARMKTAAVMALLVGGVAFGVGWLALTRGEPPEDPKPVAERAPTGPPAPRPLPHWVHLKDDTDWEFWVCLDDGREFNKLGRRRTLLDPSTQTRLTYEGEGSIVQTPDSFRAWIVDPWGRKIPTSVQELAEAESSDKVPRRAPPEERNTAQVFRDYDIETINGRRYGRTDLYVRDALGKPRLHQQLWVDLQTRLPFRRRSRLQVAEQHQYGREFRTAEFDYPADGPADLFAFGVPRGTPVVVRAEPPKTSDLPEGLQRALKGGAEALRRFPRTCRILADEHRLELFYWSCPREYWNVWCDGVTGDRNQIYGLEQPCLFHADNQDVARRPQEILDALDAGPDLPVDRLVAWFPLDQAVNIDLADGKRDYNLVRLVQGPNQPRRVEVHVLEQQLVEIPRPISEQWPYLDWNRRELTLVPDDPGADPGQVVIRAENASLRYLFYCDPARDFIAVRQVEWRKTDGKWGNRQETRAVRWKELPNGFRYVSVWDHRWRGSVTRVLGPGKLETTEEDAQAYRRIAITPLTPDQLPKDLFDGTKFLEAARKEGAIIEVD